MASKPTRVGLVGLSAKGSWASTAHLPYLKATPHYTITALANSSREAAASAAKTYELNATPYGSIDDLVHDPDVDLVAVSVNVPRHLELLEPAIQAGKDVFVEWPLAANLQEASHLSALVKEYGVRTLVGLQSRQSPAILAAKKLVEKGDLGGILGTTMTVFSETFGAQIPEKLAYCAPIENGANLLTIPFGHCVDAMAVVVGELESLNATLGNLWPEVGVDGEKGEVRKVAKTAHDFISVNGTLERGGGVATVVFRGGAPPKGVPGYRWDIYGERGTLVLEAESWIVQPRVRFVGEEVREVEVEQAAGFDFNVGRAWEAFKEVGGGRGAPGFEEALVRHRMIDAIYRSHETGSRVRYL